MSGVPGLLRFRPPLIGLTLLGLASAAQLGLGTPPIVTGPWRWLGIASIAAGLALAAWPIAIFHRAGTTRDPVERPSALVTGGPYRFTRNPMYLGLTAVLLGIGLLIGTLPFLLVPAVFAIVMDRLFVPREERVLDETLGPPYEEYRRHVRRWL